MLQDVTLPLFYDDLVTIYNGGQCCPRYGGALLGRQSDVLLNEQDLIDGLAQQRQRVEQDPTLSNPDWVVYRVEAHEVEFWQGDIQRNHGRLRYRRSEPTGQAWVKERLWP
ncbi:hypothetical protein E4695_03360 [Alcaligenaceae bacterium 429]|nr:hypothetical protein E4695_03360 [Alcaligenaceae bacterium 429]